MSFPILLLIGGSDAGDGGGGGGGGETLPTAPSGLNVTVLGADSLRLSWVDNSSNETQFQIDRKIGAGAWADDVARTDANVLTYDDTDLTEDVLYTYRVSAINGVGQSGTSSEASGTPASTPPGVPTAPSDVAAAMQATNTTIRITWTDASGDETGFRVYRSVNGAAFALLHTTAAGVETYDNTGLTLGNTYAYKVASVNATGESLQIGPATVTNLGAPGQVTGLTALRDGTFPTSRVDLAWTVDESGPPAGTTTHVKIVRNGVDLITVAVTSAYEDTGLADGTSYSYRIVALNTGIAGTASDAAEVATGLAAPTTFQAAFLGEGGDRRFTWTNNATNETGFSLERTAIGAGSGDAYTPFTTVGADVTQADVASADVEGRWWRVKATGGAGVPASSASNSVQTL